MFFSGPPTTGILTLSLHDALPIFLDAHELAKLTGRKDVDHLLAGELGVDLDGGEFVCPHCGGLMGARHFKGHEGEDRKSTRLNSSHITISYAVFCLKKKNLTTDDK